MHHPRAFPIPYIHRLAPSPFILTFWDIWQYTLLSLIVVQARPKAIYTHLVFFIIFCFALLDVPVSLYIPHAIDIHPLFYFFPLVPSSLSVSVSQVRLAHIMHRFSA